jgi:hypothetical protein
MLFYNWAKHSQLYHIQTTYTLDWYFALPPFNYSVQGYDKYLWYVKKNQKIT